MRSEPIEDYRQVEDAIMMTDKMIKIFESLLYGGKTVYTMSNESAVGISLSRIHNLCVEMEDRGFVRSESRTENGRNKRIFFPTMAGLWAFYWSNARKEDMAFKHFKKRLSQIMRLDFFQTELWQDTLKEEPLLAFIGITRNKPEMVPSPRGDLRFEFNLDLMEWLIGAIALPPDAEQRQVSVRILDRHPKLVLAYLEEQSAKLKRREQIINGLKKRLEGRAQG